MPIIEKSAEILAEFIIDISNKIAPLLLPMRDKVVTRVLIINRKLSPFISKLKHIFCKCFFSVLCVILIPVCCFFQFYSNTELRYRFFSLFTYIAFVPLLFYNIKHMENGNSSHTKEMLIWFFSSITAIGSAAVLLFFDKLNLFYYFIMIIMLLFGGVWLTAGLLIETSPATHCLFAGSITSLSVFWEMTNFHGNDPSLIYFILDDVLIFEAVGLICYFLWRFFLALYAAIKKGDVKNQEGTDSPLKTVRHSRIKVCGHALLACLLLYAVYVSVSTAWILTRAPKGTISQVETAQPWDIRFLYDNEPYHYVVEVGSVWRFPGKMWVLGTVLQSPLIDDMGGLQGYKEGVVWLQHDYSEGRGIWKVGCDPFEDKAETA